MLCLEKCPPGGDLGVLPAEVKEMMIETKKQTEKCCQGLDMKKMKIGGFYQDGMEIDRWLV